MPARCATCEHPQVREINHRIREKRPLVDISRWLDDLGTPITRQALARHAKQHLGIVPERGRVPVSGDFLTAVRDRVHARMEAGEIEPTLRDGIAAQKQLDARMARNADRDLVLKIGLLLTAPRPALMDPEVEALEAEFRPLLEAGD